MKSIDALELIIFATLIPVCILIMVYMMNNTPDKSFCTSAMGNDELTQYHTEKIGGKTYMKCCMESQDLIKKHDVIDGYEKVTDEPICRWFPINGR